MEWVYADEVKIFYGRFFITSSCMLCCLIWWLVDCWMQECVTSGLPLQKNPWRHWEDFMQWCSHLSYWSGQFLNTIVRYLVFALTEKVGDVIHDMIRLYLPITKKVCDVIEEILWHDVCIFRWSGQSLNTIVRYLEFTLTEKSLWRHTWRD